MILASLALQVIAATNRPDVLDPALLRSGRLDRKIELPHPNEDARERILQIHARKMTVNKAGRFHLNWGRVGPLPPHRRYILQNVLLAFHIGKVISVGSRDVYSGELISHGVCRREFPGAC